MRARMAAFTCPPRLPKLLQPCDSRIELQFTAANNVSQPANTSRPKAHAVQQTARSTHRRAREVRGVVVARIAVLSRVLEQPLPPAHTRRQQQRLLQVGGGQRTDLVQLLGRAPARIAGGV